MSTASRPGARARSLVTALLLALAPGSPAQTPTPAPAAPPRADTLAPALPAVTPARPVHDASHWAAVKGPLRPLWEAWKAELVGQGILMDDDGHQVNLESGTLVSSYRADSVPAAAIAFMVANAATLLPGVLVAGDPGTATALVGQEAARVAAEEAAAQDAAEAAEEASRPPAGSTTGPGPGPGSDAAPRPGDPTPVPSSPATTAPAGSGPGTATTTTPVAADTGEPVPDLVGPATVAPGSTAKLVNVDGVAPAIYVPPTWQPGAPGFGLIVLCGDIAGNTDYQQKKMAMGIDAHKLVSIGLKARQTAPGRYQWEADTAQNIEYIKKVARSALGEWQLDPARTVLFGFSNGAGMVFDGAPALSDTFKAGFISVEGYSQPAAVAAKYIVMQGKAPPQESTRTADRWIARVEGMGHFIPGPKVYPGVPDPGLSTDTAGNRCDGQAMLDWVFGTGATPAGSQGP